YTLRAVDFTGNRAVDGSGNYITATINVVTSDFAMTSAQQLASDSAIIYFNHPIADTAFTVQYKHENDASWTTVASTDITKETNSIAFTLSPSFKSGVYGIRISNVTSIYGVAPQSDNISLTTDGDGPVITAHSFTGINAQDAKSVLVTFNEPVKTDSVSNVPTAFSATKTLNGVTTSITVNTATYKTETSILLTFAEDLLNSATYKVSAPLSRDLFGNLGSSTPHILSGRDLTAPTIKVSAFSNPMNARDLIVVATTNETLIAPPTLYVEQTGYSTAAITMKAHPTNPMAYMASVSVQSNRSKFGNLKVTASDLSNNIGTSSIQFFVGSVRANVASEILSDDKSVRLSFKVDSLKADSDIRLLERLLEKENEADQTIRSSLQDEYLVGTGLRASSLRPSKQELSNSAELVPISPAYEVTVPAENVASGFDVAIKSPVATTTIGVGLFYQSGNTWKFVSAYKNADNAYAARIRSTQVFAIMRDMAAPTLTLDEKLDLTVPFTTSRPEFCGNIIDAGSGVDLYALEAVIDGKLTQKFTCNDDGNFVFVPLTPLEGGAHTIEIKGGDRTGNKVASPQLRFEVVKELKVTQIVQYPNPARGNYMNIRFITNRSDITEDNVKIKIYDVAGHRVRTIDSAPRKIDTTYDFRWDMLNGKGKRVANGVYFAKVEIKDPNNPAIKFKKTLKLAVLR
ncbi:MAG: FlgD immunoglobulin-like domain containing protein, partial [Candidatus Riflebacteria bacterium]|nr:FlgD immunoglobulin-like domain containing protein [Candidatus Riflebacteria bacterium]